MESNVVAARNMKLLKVEEETYESIVNLSENSGISIQEAATRAMEAGLPILKQALQPLVDLRNKKTQPENN
jgi:hypothetical protein